MCQPILNSGNYDSAIMKISDLALQGIERMNKKPVFIPKGKGLLVQTSKGIKGRTFYDETFHNGKMKVYLVDENLQLKKGKDGKLLKMLCDPNKLNRIGFVD